MSISVVVGVPWYTRQNYRRILEIMEDAHLLPSTFDKWLHAAEEVIESCKNTIVVANYSQGRA